MSTASTVEREMLVLINQERTSRGLTPLQLETQLNASSEDHSMWMLDTDRFSHTGSGGSTVTQRMEAAGFDLEGSWRTGENIAWQSERGAPGISDDVAQLHQNLMSSPGHRANILNPDFKYIGIGIESGDMQGFDAVMITQNFATTSADVLLDNGQTPVEEDVSQPVEPEEEPPVTEVDDPVPPAEETPETDDPVAEVETPEEDVTEEEVPVAETEDPVEEDETPVAETDDPVEDDETPVAETDDPVEDDETPVAETDDPVAEDETPVAETDDPVAEDETPVAETDEPETPGEDIVEVDTPAPDMPAAECFDVAAFLTEIEAFVERLQARLEQFDWIDRFDNQPEADDFELVTDMDEDNVTPEDTVEVTADDTCEFAFFYTTCDMDFV